MAGLAFCPDGQKTYFVRSVKATARREGLAWASPLFGKPLSCTAVLSRSKRRRWAGQCFASNSASAANRRRPPPTSAVKWAPPYHRRAVQGAPTKRPPLGKERRPQGGDRLGHLRRTYRALIVRTLRLCVCHCS